MTDASLLAEHLLWEATTAAAANKAFNVVNGDIFRWRKMWRQIAGYFGSRPPTIRASPSPLAGMLKGVGPECDGIVSRYGLKRNSLEYIAPFWHVDADLGRTQECMADMGRSRELGFLCYRRTWMAFQNLFDRLRQERINP